uniref:Oocyst wall protein n=1 Tax=Chromera velia CCMP2878 TaxID=1169474 RepID=A0A0G4HKF4_9ALVE|mmetsp:Transcript_16215/g.32836  ORF Transcript_16215/g.32836 Transcript_16215/m.32836 type:complete len:294 (+) Transcript_16215:219-1100(+)|eukprot:Cvel_28430.t1-p1 / transcript=Cvel_28430.t1 / gene=Cvel_28430 / organism=Chromera_velia_CCMP2878 / gene_product=hypothetical protein / transcript_product=hypothetical protein / location=Cvel_scaffold3720:5816-9278(+) / protein_length=293 / sequence_SO=supercontig / SO=protein_coding / is_pseudo=false
MKTHRLVLVLGASLVGKVAGQAGCAKGWYREANTCVMKQTLPYICNKEGWAPMENTCQQIKFKRAKKECEEGYDKQLSLSIDSIGQHVCVSKEKVHPMLSCGIGWNFDGKNCIFEEFVAPVGMATSKKGFSPAYLADGSVACPVGAFPAEHGGPPECVIRRETPPIRKCPEGFLPLGGMPGEDKHCVRISQLPLQYVCDPGYLKFTDGTTGCYYYEWHDMYKSCPKGWELTPNAETRVDECVRYLFHPPIDDFCKGGPCDNKQAVIAEAPLKVRDEALMDSRVTAAFAQAGLY